MKISQRITTCVAAMLAFSMAPALQAGEITGVTWFSGVASVAGTVFSPPVDPNNDDVAGTSPNGIFVTQKDYVAIGPVDLVFDVVNTGGVTEYFVMEGVSNSTGLDWSSYHIELGFGIGAGFTKSVSGDDLDFDAPSFNSDLDFNPSPGVFPTVSATEDDIIASGGVLPNLGFAGNFLFHVDVPDGITSFTIRQSPIAGGHVVPVPAALSLGLAGMLSLGLIAGRQRRRDKRSRTNGAST